MVVNLKAVFTLNRIINSREMFNIHIIDISALPAPEVIVPVGASIIPLQAVRKRDLADYTATGKLAQVAVYGSLAYGWVILVNLRVYLLNGGMSI